MRVAEAHVSFVPLEGAARTVSKALELEVVAVLLLTRQLKPAPESETCALVSV